MFVRLTHIYELIRTKSTKKFVIYQKIVSLGRRIVKVLLLPLSLERLLLGVAFRGVQAQELRYDGFIPHELGEVKPVLAFTLNMS